MCQQFPKCIAQHAFFHINDSYTVIPYQNKSQKSGIAAYEIGPDYIRIEFTTGAIYEYNHEHTGAAQTEHLKYLAEQGKGLNSYLNQKVHKKYSQRLQ